VFNKAMWTVDTRQRRKKRTMEAVRTKAMEGNSAMGAQVDRQRV
jgi:hypothetical protein